MKSSKAVAEGSLKPLRNTFLIEGIEQGERVTKAGVIIIDDNLKHHGVRPRWAKVYAIGNDIDFGFKVGDYVLLEHGHWSKGIWITDPERGDVYINIVTKDVAERGLLGMSEENPL